MLIRFYGTPRNAGSGTMVYHVMVAMESRKLPKIRPYNYVIMLQFFKLRGICRESGGKPWSLAPAQVIGKPWSLRWL